MNAGNDDFWGSQSDWSDRANTQPTSRVPWTDASTDEPAVQLDVGAERPGHRIKRRLSNLSSSGANPTREHGIVRPEAARSLQPTHDMFDDLDDFDYAYGDTPVAAWTPDPAAATEQQDRDAEFAPAPAVARQAESSGVDPLLMRFGVVALVATLVVSALLSFRGDSASSLVESSNEPPATLDLLLADAAAAEVPTMAAAGQLDPNDLLPAVPVNTQPAAVAAAAPFDAEPVAAVQSLDSETTSTNGDAALNATVVDASADRVEHNCAIDYEVVAGDFWIRLAGAADVPLVELLEANGAASSTPIYPGTSICLPAGATTPMPPPTTNAPVTTTAPTVTPTVTPTGTAPTATTPAATAPTGTTTTGTTPSSTNSTPDEVKQIIRDVWPDELEERAIEIAYRESRFVPTAKNFCCYGLFQMYWTVHQSWLNDIGITDDQQLYDPATNARAAYELYQRAGGWGPWGY